MTDPQDPLPEPHFFWRRWFTYATTLLSLAIVGYVAHRVAGDSALSIVLALIAFAAWQSTLYMVAPSAETIMKIVAHIVRLRRP